MVGTAWVVAMALALAAQPSEGKNRAARAAEAPAPHDGERDTAGPAGASSEDAETLPPHDAEREAAGPAGAASEDAETLPPRDAAGPASASSEDAPFERAVFAGFVLEAGLLGEGRVMLGPELEYGQVLTSLTDTLRLVVGGRAGLRMNEDRSATTRVQITVVELAPWIELRWLLSTRVMLSGGAGAGVAGGRSVSSSAEGGLVGFEVGFVPTARARVVFAPSRRVLLSAAACAGGAYFGGLGLRPIGALVVGVGLGF